MNLHPSTQYVHIIYIPGFGGNSDWLRRLALKRWKSRSVAISFIPMQWTDRNETYKQKYQRIMREIDQHPDDTIILVGESAGGPLALYTYTRHSSRIHQVITLCGYNHGAAEVHPIHKIVRPAFYALMPAVDPVVASLSNELRARITTIFSTRDNIVRKEHSTISRAQSVELSTPGHFFTIVFLLLSKRPLRHIK